ncbi:MAG: GNAT family N-acetyltransferase [Allobranchiibius sp.]
MRRIWGRLSDVLRTSSPARTLGASDFDAALAVCRQDPQSNVFVAARLLEAGPAAAGSLIAIGGQHLSSMCWVSANIVPIGCDARALDVYAAKLRRYRRRCSSIFGEADQVLGLWERLEPTWGQPRSLRPEQPMMIVTTSPRDTGRPMDPRVRLAREDELDLVVPASAHMFTGEIGYPPYTGSDHEYRRLVRSLIRAGHTYVIVEAGRVLFKADVGSLAFGVAQIQGVWVAPKERGRGLAIPAMNSVVQHVLDHLAEDVTLYVNSYNEPALRSYRATGFETIANFATIIL